MEAALVAVMMLAACSGGARSLPPVFDDATLQGNTSVTDLGRSNTDVPVDVVVLLRYAHKAELDRFVDGLARAHRRRYLTRAQFDARYAPTPQQERHAIAILRANGFTVKRRFSNRTLVDVKAPSQVVERFFSTQIHRFSANGRLFVGNVRPLRIPAELQGLAAGADANGVPSMHTALRYERIAPASPERDTMGAGAARNVVRNPGFESGKLAPWHACVSSPHVLPPALSTAHPHDGQYDALVGTTTASEAETDGRAAVCQLVKIPDNGRLRLWSYQVSNDSHPGVSQFGALFSQSGRLRKLLYAFDRTQTWTQLSFDLSPYQGQSDYLAFGVIGTAKDKHEYIGQYIDDVELTGLAPSPSPSPSPSLGPMGTWAPESVEKGLHMPSLEGYTGAGQTIAIVIDQPARASDLKMYLKAFGIKQTGSLTNKPSVDCNAPTSCAFNPKDFDIIEAALDAQTIVGLAPAANVIVYVVPFLSATFVEDAYNEVLADGEASVVNSSFTLCESMDQSYDQVTDQIAEQGAATGVTFTASTGDAGSLCYNGNEVFGVSSPASDPHFVAVGGTQSTSPYAAQYCHISQTKADIVSGTVWNDCVGSGGGGLSTVWPEPSNQSGVHGASSSGRNVPDIALPAVGTVEYLEAQGGWLALWGTSWSAPQYAAMQAEINQLCGSAIWGTSALYGAFAATRHRNDFIDVTGGNNSYQGSPPYAAASGFDDASGIGIPLGIQVAADNGCGVR